MKRFAFFAALAFLATPAIAASPSFSITCASAIEGDGVPCNITRTGVATTYSKVQIIAHGGGSATNGVDFPAFNTTFTIGKTIANKLIYIPTTADTLKEGDEQFQVQIKAVRYATIAGTGFATATIIDLVATPPPPPPPPPVPPPVPAKGTALALQACAAINRNESVIVGRTYNVVEFGHDANGSEFAVLSDASHLGDGYFSLYVNVLCLQIGT